MKAKGFPLQKEALIAQKNEIIEGLMGLAILVAVNFLWFRDNLGFMGIHPHPYWIVVLLISSRYGFRGGLSAGLMAALTFVVMLRASRPDLGLYEFLDTRYLTTPFLFVVVGIFFGEIRQIRKREYEELKEKNVALGNAFKQLSINYEAVSKAKEELDTRIISQEHTLSTLYGAAQALKSLQEKDIYPSVLQLLKDFLSAEACSIYLLSKDTLQLAAGLGDRGGASRPGKVHADEGVMGSAISEKKTVSINTLISSEKFRTIAASGIIIAAPLITGTGKVLGVLNIEKLPFLKFNPQSVRMAALIADWCTDAVENARTYKETKDRNISDDITGAYTYTYFQERVVEEFSRAKRYKLTVSVLTLVITDFSEFSDHVKQDVLTVLSLILRNKLRDVDLLFHDLDPGTYGILLPHTPHEGGERTRERILEEIDAFKFKPYDGDERLLNIEIKVVEDLERFKNNMNQAGTA